MGCSRPASQSLSFYSVPLTVAFQIPAVAVADWQAHCFARRPANSCGCQARSLPGLLLEYLPPLRHSTTDSDQSQGCPPTAGVNPHLLLAGIVAIGDTTEHRKQRQATGLRLGIARGCVFPTFQVTIRGFATLIKPSSSLQTVILTIAYSCHTS